MSRHESSTEKICEQRKLNGSPNGQSVTVVDDLEDIFDQTDDVVDEKQFANKQYDKYTERFYNEGFREALSALQDEAEEGTVNLKENILQKSFDQGYASAIQVARQLLTAKSAVQAYLQLSKKDKIDFLKVNPTAVTDQAIKQPVSNEYSTEIDELNSDLEEAQTKLSELIKNGNRSTAIDLHADLTAKNNEHDNQKRINEMEQIWRSKINELFDYEDLKKRTARLLSIDI